MPPDYRDLAPGRGRAPAVLPLTANPATGASTLIVAPAAGFRVVIVSLQLTTGDVTGGLVSLKSGAGGTIQWQAYVCRSQTVEDSPGVGLKVCQFGTGALVEINNGVATAVAINVRYILEQIL